MDSRNISQQECIPVGCILSATVAVTGGWGVCPEGGVCPGGCVFPGVCLTGGCLSREVLPNGVSAEWSVCPGDVCPGVSTRGVSAWWGVCQTPPMDRMTDMCKNITLPQLRCGR